MSAETMEWLNQYTLQTDREWHYREEFQKDGGNVFERTVPLEAIERLMGWKAVEGSAPKTTLLLPDGVVEIEDNTWKPICRPPGALGPDDQGAILYNARQGYKIHDYMEWLVRNVMHLVGDSDLVISAAGLLKKGAQAWVNITIPETLSVEGVEFRPYLLAATSLDGSIATSYGRKVLKSVCDNTVAAALGEKNQKISFRHTANSLGRIKDTREALNLLEQTAGDFEAQVAEFCAVDVSQGQWDKVLDALVPLPEQEGNAYTRAENKRDILHGLWAKDERVAPWKNTKYGVMQAFNTYDHWYRGVRGAERAERNMERTIKGEFEANDAKIVATLDEVLATV
jgi:phage/plasmid-like protein (TIGR03299 family)